MLMSNMKRTLVAVSALVAISAFAFHGSHKEHKEPLPNFDRRTDNSPKTAPEVEAPHRAAAVAALRARVPQLEITRNKVLKSPDFFSSRQEFLTGPNGEGLAVAAATAR